MISVKWSVWKWACICCVNLSTKLGTIVKEKLYVSVGLTYTQKRWFC